MSTVDFLLLATEATEEGGFGLNFNILETNLVNLTILISLLIYFGRNFLGKILSERQDAIQDAIQDAERRQQEAVTALASQKKSLAEAKSTAEKIKSDAEVNARNAREEILAQAQRDIQRLKEEAARDLSTQQDRIVLQLRQRIAAMAVEKVESTLQSRMDDALQQKLVDKSIAMLGG